jgi:hypothetical protein
VDDGIETCAFMFAEWMIGSGRVLSKATVQARAPDLTILEQTPIVNRSSPLQPLARLSRLSSANFKLTSDGAFDMPYERWPCSINT